MVSADADAVPCDFCASERAVVFCRADSARLCLACDREVHAANSVSSQHSRSLLCDICDSAAASIFCSTPFHRLVLCSYCDFNAHQTDNHCHVRRSLDPFSGCPDGIALAAALGLGEDKGALSDDAEDGWAWEATLVFSWDDLISQPSATPFHGYDALAVAPPQKDKISSCGKRKEEIHRQIRKLLISEASGIDYSDDIEPLTEFRSLPPENLRQEELNTQNGSPPVFVAVPNCEANNLQCNLCENWTAVSSPVEASYEQQTGKSLANPTFADGAMEAALHASLSCDEDKMKRNQTAVEDPSSMQPKDDLPDRSSVILRYKEKRRTRRYDKLIRYESRKAMADSRLRIKGRFAKVNQVSNP